MHKRGSSLESYQLEQISAQNSQMKNKDSKREEASINSEKDT